MSGADIDDIAWRADGATATFRYGWGDCFLGREGVHDWTVDLPDGGPAALIAESGDPVPGDVIAYAAGLPPP